MKSDKFNGFYKSLLSDNFSPITNTLKSRLEFLKLVQQELKNGENYWLTTLPNKNNVCNEFVVNATVTATPNYCPFVYVYLRAFVPTTNKETGKIGSTQVAEICAKVQRKHIFVENLVVFKGFRGNGIASAMLQLLNKIAYKQHKKEIVLYSCINMKRNNANLTQEMKEFLNNKQVYEDHEESLREGKVDANAVLYIQKNGFESIHENKEMLNKYGMSNDSLNIPMVKKVQKSSEPTETAYAAYKSFMKELKKTKEK